MLVCATCTQSVTFGPKGWEHVTADSCTGAVIAWPEAVEVEDGPFEGTAGDEAFDEIGDFDAA